MAEPASRITAFSGSRPPLLNMQANTCMMEL
jgi:hypothetical protein